MHINPLLLSFCLFAVVGCNLPAPQRPVNYTVDQNQINAIGRDIINLQTRVQLIESQQPWIRGNAQDAAPVAPFYPQLIP